MKRNLFSWELAFNAFFNSVILFLEFKSNGIFLISLLVTEIQYGLFWIFYISNSVL